MTKNQARPDAVRAITTGSVAPLLSPSGRDFLEGSIDADQYVESARHTAAELAKSEVDGDANRDVGSLRKIIETALYVAAGAYTILGVSTLSFGGSNVTVGATAFATGLVLAILGVSISAYFRNGRGGPDAAGS